MAGEVPRYASGVSRQLWRALNVRSSPAGPGAARRRRRVSKSRAAATACPRTINAEGIRVSPNGRGKRPATVAGINEVHHALSPIPTTKFHTEPHALARMRGTGHQS